MIVSEKSRDLFAEVRNMNASKTSNPVSVDGMAGDSRYLSCLVINMNNYITVYNVIDSIVFEKIKMKINERVLN